MAGGSHFDGFVERDAIVCDVLEREPSAPTRVIAHLRPPGEAGSLENPSVRRIVERKTQRERGILVPASVLSLAFISENINRIASAIATIGFRDENAAGPLYDNDATVEPDALPPGDSE
jgi:hypothetical protein